MRSAGRYDAYAGRPREVTALELRRRSDIAAAVKAYVGAVLSGEDGGEEVETWMRRRFAADDAPTADWLVKRTTELVVALHDGNHVPYGISRREFDDYSAVTSARPGQRQ